jgi:peptidylprolyl isomerase
MRAGDEKRISIPSEQAFGRRCGDLIQPVPRTLVPEKTAIGDQLSVSIDGTILDVWVQKLAEESVTLDANHPLAGESLVVDVEVLRVGSRSDADQECQRMTPTSTR